MILNDRQIAKLCTPDNGTPPMVAPFEPKLVNRTSDGERIISYGLSSFGYDARLDRSFKIATNVSPLTVVDPKKDHSEAYVEHRGDNVLIPPHGFVLAQTFEYFHVPEDVIAICMGKSTYARTGIIVNITPLEPGWHGHVTLEISNTNSLPARVHAGEGICQFLFLKGERPETTYLDRGGKYLGQTEVTLPRV